MKKVDSSCQLYKSGNTEEHAVSSCFEVATLICKQRPQGVARSLAGCQDPSRHWNSAPPHLTVPCAEIVNDCMHWRLHESVPVLCCLMRSVACNAFRIARFVAPAVNIECIVSNGYHLFAMSVGPLFSSWHFLFPPKAQHTPRSIRDHRAVTWKQNFHQETYLPSRRRHQAECVRLGVGRGPPVANETKEHTRSSMQAYIKCIHQPIKSSACFIMHPWPSTGQWYAIWMICISHSSRYGTLRRKREIPVLVVSARPMSSSSTFRQVEQFIMETCCKILDNGDPC